MSKRKCIPKTPHEIHKQLIQQIIPPRSEYELLGPFNKYRNENKEIYLMKCEEFKSKVKECRDANVKALTNHKLKPGELYKNNSFDKNLDDLIPICEDSGKIEFDFDIDSNTEELTLVSKITSVISFTTINETGKALRKRHEKYCTEFIDMNDRFCFYEPWYRRYLIFCKFISLTRNIIIKNRLLKRLEKLKAVTPEMIEKYEKEYLKYEHQIYPEIFQTFNEPKPVEKKKVENVEKKLETKTDDKIDGKSQKSEKSHMKIRQKTSQKTNSLKTE